MRSARGFSKWLMRFALITFIFFTFFDVIDSWNFSDINYLISFAFVAFGFLLIVGGFIPKSGLTIISGLLIFIAAILKIILLYLDADKIVTDMAIYLILAAIGFFYFSHGDIA